MEGDAWVSEELGLSLDIHPIHLIGPEDRLLVELHAAFQGSGMAPGHLPFPGGYADQPACVMRSFGVIGAALQRLEPPDKKRRDDE